MRTWCGRKMPFFFEPFRSLSPVTQGAGRSRALMPRPPPANPGHPSSTTGICRGDKLVLAMP